MWRLAWDVDNVQLFNTLSFWRVLTEMFFNADFSVLLERGCPPAHFEILNSTWLV